MTALSKGAALRAPSQPRTGQSKTGWLDRPDGRQLALFVLSATLAAVANLMSRYFLNTVLPFEASVGVGFCIGAVVAFGLYHCAFGNPQTPLGLRIRRFCGVALVGVLIGLAVSSLLARVVLPLIGWTYRPFDVAHVAGVAAPAVWSFLGHRRLTYSACL